MADSFPGGSVHYLSQRGRRLAELLASKPVLLYNGQERPRNYPANSYPFRPDSSFLYFAGVMPPGSFWLWNENQAHLFVPEITAEDAVWSGPGPSRQALAEASGSTVHALEELPAMVSPLKDDLASLPTQDPGAADVFLKIIGRIPDPDDCPGDKRLAEAIIEMRLGNDTQACQELRRVGRATAEAHLAAMVAIGQLQPGRNENYIRAVMDFSMLEQGFCHSFSPIITVNGQYLHQIKMGAPLKAGDLLLIDYGLESDTFWCGDITNTLPVSGVYSPTQRHIYDLVWKAHASCRDMLKPGVRYLHVHKQAMEIICQGLLDLGILQGSFEEVWNSQVTALFMPHGVGHLMGIDVHDMENFGDRVGYAPGRQRSKAFGWKWLRLDRDLRPGMALTIEPGIYFIPEILHNSAMTENCRQFINEQVLSQYMGVHGVRIERDYLITEEGFELLTPGMPNTSEEVEAYLRNVSSPTSSQK